MSIAGALSPPGWSTLLSLVTGPKLGNRTPRIGSVSPPQALQSHLDA